MPYKLDDTDVAILKSLFEDGRKSFRQISREIKISTPTIKMRYQRLVNVGLIKSVSPIIDTSKLEKKSKVLIDNCHCETKTSKIDLSKDLQVSMYCDLCDGPISENPTILKFANIERFFCCTSCRGLYKEKYKGRINSVIKNSQ